MATKRKITPPTLPKKQPLQLKTPEPAPSTAEVEEVLSGLDRFDIRILRELQSDGRLTNAELSERIGLSPAPCWRRVKRLESEGYISGYHAQLNRHKLGLGVIAFVRLYADVNTGAVTRELRQALVKLPEVMDVHHISGEGSFEITVLATDLESYSRFAMETLINLPHVKDLHTSFSLGEVKASRELPLGHLSYGR
ncbi:MAG: Lrp/AsnC family transcriptional regulator [Burkholderiales bacterium]|nr:MAG: Lrp/AsnC family transcriptional regulator [Burkholderiales bacterium]